MAAILNAGTVFTCFTFKECVKRLNHMTGYFLFRQTIGARKELADLAALHDQPVTMPNSSGKFMTMMMDIPSFLNLSMI